MKRLFIFVTLFVALTALVYWLLGRNAFSGLPALETQTVSQTATPVPTDITLDEDSMIVTVYLVGLEEKGYNGVKFGCNDVLVPYKIQTEKTKGILRASLDEMLSGRDRFVKYEGKELYNVFYQSDLYTESVVINNGKTTIRLRGNLSLSGTCDTPRVSAQLIKTATQFPEVTETEIFINGKTLEESLSTK